MNEPTMWSFYQRPNQVLGSHDEILAEAYAYVMIKGESVEMVEYRPAQISDVIDADLSIRLWEHLDEVIYELDGFTWCGGGLNMATVDYEKDALFASFRNAVNAALFVHCDLRLAAWQETGTRILIESPGEEEESEMKLEYVKSTSYLFEDSHGVGFEVYLFPSGESVYVGTIEETRKNGQEDTHFYAEVVRFDDGRFGMEEPITEWFKQYGYGESQETEVNAMINHIANEVLNGEG